MTWEAPSSLVLLQDTENFNIHFHTLVYPSRIAQREDGGTDPGLLMADCSQLVWLRDQGI